MRSDDEDEEDDFDEENEEDDEGLDTRVNGTQDGEDDAMEFYEEDGSGEENEEEDGDGEGEGEAEGEDEEDDEEEDEDQDGDDDDEEDEEDDEDHSDDDGEADDVDMANGDEASSHTSRGSNGVKSAFVQPQPPHLARRGLFTPAFTSPPKSVSIEAIVAIPLPCPVYSIASTTCSSYLLTGGADGHIRAYDFWSSVNGNQLMTAQQKTIVGLGEGVNKAGVARGWWSNEVEGIKDGAVSKRLEAVYSMAVEGDGLWALTGTQSGPINLYTLRHSPGHLVHSLKGHSNVVSCMSLLPGEKGFLSGSWDGTVREWDLNTGQTVRQYPTHGAQISSLSFRPYHPLSPTPSPQPRLANGDADEEDDDMLNGTRVSVSVGPDFDKPKSTDTGADTEKPPDSAATITDAGNEVNGKAEGEADGDVAMSDAPSPFDPLFDDEDADGETVIPSGEVTMAGTPAINDMVPPSPAKPKPGSGLALPGSKPIKQEAPVSAVPSSAPSGSSTPLFNMPQPVASSSKTAAANIPILSPADFRAFSDDIFLTSSMDGQVVLIDRRVPDYGGSNGGVGRLQPSEKAPPWCMSACWSGDGKQILAGRRNGTIDIWDVRRHSTSSSPSLLRTLRTPAESGPVSCVVALPDGQHVATASQDNVRLWNTAEYFGPEESIKRKGSRPPFKIIAGHHGGTISSMLVDPTCRFLTTASGDRGWQGEATKVVLIHEIKW